MLLNQTFNNLFQLVRPGFRLDASLSDRTLLAFLQDTGLSWLRGFKAIFSRQLPGTLLLGRQVRLQYAQHIQMGKWVRLEDGVHLSALGNGGIHLGHHVRIGAYSRLVTCTSLGQLGGRIEIGDHVGIGEFSYLGGAGGLSIGHDCIIGQYFSCHPENHCYADPAVPIRLQGVTRKGISIGANCWIGAKVTILDGVTIGEGCVIAAGAVVTKNIPSGSVAGGVPARVLKTISSINAKS